MFNVLLDPLPYEWNGFKVDMDFQTGIQISQCITDEELTNAERVATAVSLMFPDDRPSDMNDISDALSWYMNGWNHDNISKDKKKDETILMDFDIDQWRIYAAFKKQYGIDLNRETIHFWVYMGLLSNLEECSFTRVVSIRDKKIDSKMSREEKAALKNAKKMYVINKEAVEAEEEKAEREAAIDVFNRLRSGGR